MPSPKDLLPLFRRALPWFFVLGPCAALFFLIREHAVNIPFLDDWMFVQMDSKAADGELTWRDFFIVQMEHRMAFVRAVVMLCHWWFPADYTVMMGISWLMLAGTACNVLLLLQRTTGEKFSLFWPVMALCSLVIFSPVQYQIVLWPMMFQVAAPAFFLSTSMVVQMSRLPLWVRWSTGIVCALCATLSFATGILLWLLPLPLLFLPGVIAGRRARWVYTGLWLAAFVVAMGLYFTGLKNETDGRYSYKQGNEETMNRNVSSFLSQPGRAAAFVLRLVGCHLARGTGFSVMDASLVLGGLSVLLWCGAAVYAWRRFADETLRRSLLPWLIFGAYSIGAASLIALGRVWATNTGENAVTARYVIHAVPLTVSLIVLAWLVGGDVCRRHPEWQRHVAQVLPASALVLLMLQTVSWAHGVRMMGMWESSRLRVAANTLFYNTVFNLEGDIAGNRLAARVADNLGLLDPPMLKDRRLDNFEIVPQLLSKNTAFFTALTFERDADVEGGEVIRGLARGFACLPGRARVADAVILTHWVPGEERWEIFHVTQAAGLPLYLLDSLSRDLQFIHAPGEDLEKEGVAGFTGRFDLGQLPPGEHDIMAWAYDHRERRVFPMSGCFRFDATQKRVTRLGTDPKSMHLDKFPQPGGKTGMRN